MQLSLPSLIFIYSMMGLLIYRYMQIWALLTKSLWRVADTQVTVKVCEPLVLNGRKN